jgi:hypothetical protein
MHLFSPGRKPVEPDAARNPGKDHAGLDITPAGQYLYCGMVKAARSYMRPRIHPRPPAKVAKTS